MDSYPAHISYEDPKPDDIPPMPEHWKFDKGPRFSRLKAALLFVGFGSTTTEDLWTRSHSDSPLYPAMRDDMDKRISHINLVVSMKTPPINVNFSFTRDCSFIPFPPAAAKI